MLFAESARGLDPFQLGQLQVDEDELGVERVDEMERLASRRCSADDFEALRSRHHDAEDVLEYVTVVDDEYAHRRLTPGRHQATVPALSGRPLDVFGSKAVARAAGPLRSVAAVGKARVNPNAKGLVNLRSPS